MQLFDNSQKLMNEQNYLTKNKFMPVFLEALAHLHYQSLWQAHGYLPLPYSEGLQPWLCLYLTAIGRGSVLPSGFN